MDPVTKSKIKTRFYIISDTHGKLPKPATCSTDESAFVEPIPRVDVVLHAGDLTRRSGVDEFDATFRMLRGLDAPLKLVIAGNHDWLLDDAYIERYYSENRSSGGVLAAADRVKAIVEDSKPDGVHYLAEGTYDFVLQNGAKLKIYASPSTPQYGSWGFQYDGAHDFAIPPGADVAMTHGPPRSVLDATHRGESAGCDFLLKAVYEARPKLHCFGHIHEAWGARLVAWKDGLTAQEVAVGAVRARGMNDEASIVLDTLDSVEPDRAGRLVGGGSGSGGGVLGAVRRFNQGKVDADEEKQRRKARLRKLYAARGRHVSLCTGDAHVLQPKTQTLFVNAAVVDTRYRPRQLPWIVDIELDAAEEKEEAAATQGDGTKVGS